jgi:uncharacterized membrane protein
MTDKPVFNLEVSTTRLEAFSDGVFAIAITLLIIEIKVPSEQTLEQYHGLTNYLAALWPKYFAYVQSFVIIGIYWANHHYIFKLYRRTNHVFNLLNVLFLMTIAFLPFPTGVLGEFFLAGKHSKTSISFYAFAIWMPAFCWLLMWLYARGQRRLIDHKLTDGFVNFLTKQFYFSNLLYVLAFLVSLFSSIASMSLCVGLTLLYLLPPRKPEYKENV